MSTYLNSPGVVAREVDFSQIGNQPTTVGAAIIGPTVKGPVEIPTLVTSYSEYVNIFGDSFTFGQREGATVDTTYLTSISAESYFNHEGTSLLVTRVVSGSFTAATSTPILNTVPLSTSIPVGADTNLSASISTFPIGVRFNQSYTVTPTGGSGEGLEIQYSPQQYFDWTTFALTTKYQIDVTKPGTGYIATDVLTIPGAQLGLNPDGRLIPGQNNLSQSIDNWDNSYNIRSGRSWGAVHGPQGYSGQIGAWGKGVCDITYVNGGITNFEIVSSPGSRNDYTDDFNIGERYKSYVTRDRSTRGTRYVYYTLSAANFEAHTPLEITLTGDNIITQVGDVAFELETLTKGTVANSIGPENDGNLLLGTKDNIRWEIPEVNTSTGEFSLLIRRGDDTNDNKVVLETYTRLSLDPNSRYYISRVIGDQAQVLVTEGTDTYLDTTGDYVNNSKYVRVKSVAYKTPNYLGNIGTPSATYVTYVPVVQSGSFAGASGDEMPDANSTFYKDIVENSIYTSQGVPAASYASAIALLANKDDYKYNVITVPGLTYANSAHVSTLTSLVQNTQNRGDAIAIVDIVNYGATISAVKTAAAALDSSYAATYWPWLELQDPSTGLRVNVPPSTLIPGVFAYTDKVAAPWFAPAGIKRGVLGTSVVGERKLTQSSRDELYTSKVNPITFINGTGSVLFGQKTLQTNASALDRINVRRLLIEMKNYFEQIAGGIVFEQNSATTRNSFINKVTPYLEGIQQNQGLYAFKIVMDESNNTSDVIDRNQLVGQVYIQPTKTAEFVYLDFNITPTGVAFPS